MHPALWDTCPEPLLSEYRLREIHRLWPGEPVLRRWTVGPEKVHVWRMALYYPYGGEHDTLKIPETFYGYTAQEVIKEAHDHVFKRTYY